MKRANSRVGNLTPRSCGLAGAVAVVILVAMLVVSCNHVPRESAFRFSKRPESLAPGSRLRTDGFYLHTRRWQDKEVCWQLRFYPDGKFFDGPYPIDSANVKMRTRLDLARQRGYYRVRDTNLFMEDFDGSYVRWSWRFGIIQKDSLTIVGGKVRGHLPRKTGVPSVKHMTPSIPAPQIYYFHPDTKP